MGKTITFALAAVFAALSQTSSAIAITRDRDSNPTINDDHEEDFDWNGEYAQIVEPDWLAPEFSMQAFEDENPDGINGAEFAQIAQGGGAMAEAERSNGGRGNR